MNRQTGKTFLLIVALCAFWGGCQTSEEPAPTDEERCIVTGADLSYVNEIERNGGVWRDEAGQQVDPYRFFVDKGAGMIRLRLFHTPENIESFCGDSISASGLADLLEGAKRVKTAGAGLMVSLHYGDYFNDPGVQYRPKAWQGLTGQTLLDSIYQYTYGVLEHLKKQNTLPEILVIGNETTWGFVDPWYPHGSGPGTDGWDWPEDAQKFNTAFQAVDDFNMKNTTSVKKAIHLTVETVEETAATFTQQGISGYDVLGFSFYPAFSPNVTVAEAGKIVSRLVWKYSGKEVMLLETGWKWTDEGADDYPNFLGNSPVIALPVSEQGQLDFLNALKQTLRTNGATAMFYWEPAWISSQMCDRWGMGSSYENASFFDFNNQNRPLKAFDFFEKCNPPVNADE